MEQIEKAINRLIDDKSFIEWVEGRASTRESYKWGEWINKSEYNRKLAKLAIQKYYGVAFKLPVLPDINKEWQMVYSRIQSEKQKELFSFSSKINVLHLPKLVYQVAATILVILSIGLTFYIVSHSDNFQRKENLSKKENTIITGPNEQRKIAFANGTEVILKANTRLRYIPGWVNGNKIRVHLSGEAYFSVVRSKKSSPEFQVITDNGIVNDIGTKFLVSASQKGTWVVLEKGIVRIDPGFQTPKLRFKSFEMKPGEMVSINKKSGYTKKNVNPTLYTSWATGKLRFNYTPIWKFAQRLQSMYGIRVIINDSALRDQKLNGAVYYKNLSDLVKAVTHVLKVPAYRSASGDTIYIGAQKNK